MAVAPIQVIKASRWRKVSTVARTGRRALSIRSFFLYTFLFIVILTIFASATIQAVQQKSFQPVLDEIIDRLILATYKLDSASLEIIEQGGTFDPEGWFGNDAWEFLDAVWPLVISLLTIGLWIKLFAWLVKKSPISNESNWFINNSIGLVIFLTLQMMGLLIYGAVNGTIESIPDAFHMMAIPIMAFVHFGQSLGYITKPLLELASNYYSNAQTNNITANATI